MTCGGQEVSVVEAVKPLMTAAGASGADPLDDNGRSLQPAHDATYGQRGTVFGSSRHWLAAALPLRTAREAGGAGHGRDKEEGSKGEGGKAEDKVGKTSGGHRESEVRRAAGRVASSVGDAPWLVAGRAGQDRRDPTTTHRPQHVPSGENISCPEIRGGCRETWPRWLGSSSGDCSSITGQVHVGAAASVTLCCSHQPGAEVRPGHQDCNNNLQKSKLRRWEVCVPGVGALPDNAHGSQAPAKGRHKLCRRRRTFMTIIGKTFTKIKSLYRNYRHPGRRAPATWPHIPVCDTGQVGGNHTMLCDNEQTASDRRVRNGDMTGGQQRGDQSPSGRGRHWRQSNGNNSDSGRDAGGSRAKHGDAVRRSGTRTSAVNTATSAFQRSIEVDNIRRRNKTKDVRSVRRSISSEHDRSDELYLKTFKYRDKSLNRRAKTNNISSSSEEPAGGVQAALRARPPRKRSSPTNRTESASRRPGSDHGRSRRRQARKTEQSSSSRSSSSSLSSSVARTAAGCSLRPAPTARLKKKTRVTKDVAQTEALVPPEGNSKDNTKVFLERLDSVLSDLVESEKKKISKYGQTSVTDSRPEGGSGNLQSRKKYHKKREGNREKAKNRGEGDQVSPALQQLRTTLKTVRVRKRPSPPGDVLEKHSERFTDRQAHNPRILRSHRTSQLLTQRCYQPPKRRPPRPRPRSHADDNPSDFCSSEEEQADAAQVYQVAGESETQETEAEAREGQSKAGDGEDEDTCYGSDFQGSQAPHPPDAAHDLTHVSHRPPEAADSGDFSVDSAYTGSRGATPENVLNHGVKPRRQSGGLITPIVASRVRQARPARGSSQSERLQQVKRTILSEIRDSQLYSDESINCLLEQYRHKCCHLSTAELDLVIKSVQEDLGVKPRPAQYLYQILVATEDDHTQPEVVARCEGEAEDASLLTLQSTGKSYLYERRRELGCLGRPHSSTSRYARSTQYARNKTLRPPRPRRSQDETEDEAWARAAVGGVAPGLVTQAREEAERRREGVPEPDWSHYVAQLCQQFEIKM